MPRPRFFKGLLKKILDRERRHILVLAFLSFLFFCLVSILDGWFTVQAVQPYEWENLRYWLWVMWILILVSNALIAVASLLGDYGKWSGEDFFAVLLLSLQPFILIWGGFLDAISRTVQGILWNEPFLGWVVEKFAWTWIDPSTTYGIPFLSYLVSRAFGYTNTVSIGVVVGSILSIIILEVLWLIYYLKE